MNFLFSNLAKSFQKNTPSHVLTIFGFLGLALLPVEAQNQRGAPHANYFQVEYAPDASGYMAWNEHTNAGSSVWLCRINKTTGAMNPSDGRGLLVAPFYSQAGFVQFGIDNQGLFIVYPQRANGILSIARLEPGGSVTPINLSTLPDTARNTVYASFNPAISGWISYLENGHLYLVSLANPALPILASGDLLVGPAGPRWTPNKSLVTFAVNSGSQNQLWQVDVSSGTPSVPVLVTDNRHFYDGPFPFLLPDGTEAIVAGLDRSQTLGLLTRSPGATLFSVVGLYTTPTSLQNPRVTSPEPFLSWNGAYCMYSQYTETSSNSDAYHNPGEICLADLSGRTPSIQLSNVGPAYTFEPEPCYGTYYGFYNARNPPDPTFELWSEPLTGVLRDPIRFYP